ncbi:adenosylmethionine--8-amino-7-oxononanoate transaminase (plasmid) [Alicyclobacillus fastidiosus]|uniref:Adenosylmethionine-8-amino-7-oxononanoate aminotransferase n=2 Tax=Alicyclobacillus TaxID=29330 RepID=A0ABY6ZQ36_9BACL|nr:MULTISPECIES: adenosylmethionine--8-amino-7-oxononanoate transaminase [Alicyclobacillus]WAH39173.1 adenosylmethionine--8-amino-7-oxononanoate transaminase [Alicyclobacillus dauci]WAH44954.1 adenosylmethionine--8-amino-7-oxononanoate transaminase [Alicyclobacillus fastidiosus]WAH44957.1 adenosylmethionine--8-amino-7-oxononanoate transaminase [Alicyclobacillus fastidiosus]
MTYEELYEKNRRYLWNPFTQMKEYLADEPVIIESGYGCRLRDVKGNEYWDGVSSVWLNIHGHQVPELDAAIREQLNSIAHSTLLGMGNVPAILLAEKLVTIVPRGLGKVFYSDSGAEAVEIALKMAFQYWKNRGVDGKTTFVTMREAYHGDTVGAVSVGSIDLFHQVYAPLLFPSLKIPFPNPYRNPYGESVEDVVNGSLRAVEEVFQKQGDQIAAMIVEPVQGAGGMVPMPSGYLRELRNLCSAYHILLIVDEVATGFGRTGKMFACEHDGITPDILAVAKGITGGYLPVAATLTTDEIYDAFYADYHEFKTLYHGHSYTGNQLGCAVALENLKLFEQRNLVAEVEQKAAELHHYLDPIRSLSHVGDVRQSGFMVGIELVADKATKQPFPLQQRTGVRVARRCRELGMLLRPLTDVMVFMPPLAAKLEELKDMTSILYQAIAEVTEDHQTRVAESR